MAIQTLDDFKRYCLRSLGAPVITIDVTDDQLQDRYEDALRKYQDHHYDGTAKEYFKHQITQEDYDRKYIELPDSIVSVDKIVDLRANITGSDASMMNVNYQFLLNQMHLLWSSGSIAYYEHTMQHLELMNQILNGSPTYRYNKNINRIYIDVDWESKLRVDKWIVLECLIKVDPEVNPKVFQDRWFKDYYTSLIKRQWGEQLKKYSGVQMVGGVTLNGQQIWNEAKQDIEKLEEELIERFSEPITQIYMG